MELGLGQDDDLSGTGGADKLALTTLDQKFTTRDGCLLWTVRPCSRGHRYTSRQSSSNWALTCFMGSNSILKFHLEIP